MQNDKRLVWIDMEMTGLRPERDRILEVACIVTDWRLEIVAEGPVLAVHQPDAVLEAMDEWNTSHHTASGLVERVRKSGIGEAEAEGIMLDFLKGLVAEKSSPLCGNSIGQDRRFMYRYMPRLEAFFHYRSLDVSTLKILANMWRPDIMEGFRKKEAHQALDDIRESIAELRYYRERLIRAQ